MVFGTSKVLGYATTMIGEHISTDGNVPVESPGPTTTGYIVVDSPTSKGPSDGKGVGDIWSPIAKNQSFAKSLPDEFTSKAEYIRTSIPLCECLYIYPSEELGKLAFKPLQR